MIHIMLRPTGPLTLQQHSLKSVTTIWLLPVVTLVVASSSGGMLVPALQVYSPSYALLTATFSMCTVVIGLSLSLMLLTIYVLRLVVYGYPTGASILSVFLPVGPCGQAAYSFLKAGVRFPLSVTSELWRSRRSVAAVWNRCNSGGDMRGWRTGAMVGLGYTLRQERIVILGDCLS
ncbi:voltage-dependent anion channel-domain-containing protein [Suillus paluster]|uniref:voltage-dependent anion channel-domain-containing protein n=1 Tax=Suillus paluster TaxID=48578 RepID=UPI001B87B0C0|nr:voltage-dependent anion channel-domain-containing protein [Suillus paluster]KAG1751519.1 voltage-dependent anion channel-domain-containing protein [Suillus paluster]